MNKVAYYSLKVVLRTLGLLPLKVHYVLGRGVSLLAQYVFRYRLKVVESNIAGSFPDRSPEELKKIRNDFYRHFGDIVAEAIWFGGCRNPERLRRARIVELVNHEAVDALYEKSPSVVVLYSHAGNWELLGGIEHYNYTDTPSKFSVNNYCVVYKKMSSEVWDVLMRENRFAPLADRDGFEGYLESNALIRYVITNKAEKKFYNVNTDQRPYRSAKGSVPVHFMHRDCESMAAAANLAAKFGFAVVYQSMRKDRQGHYSLEYIPICEDASKMPVGEIMQTYYDLLQADIEAIPANYLWTHRRWR